ncbi:MAG: YodC family protein [Rhizobiaceae bacterium]
MAEFKVGDVVELKSGGPWMTVISVNMRDSAVCEWFNTSKDGNQTVQRHSFPPDAIKKKT